MPRIIAKYRELLDRDTLPIQQDVLNRMGRIIGQKVPCIVAGYHGSGKSTIARRYSAHCIPLKRFYCKTVSEEDLMRELEKTDRPLFLDSMTHLLYMDRTVRALEDKAKQHPLVLGVHIEPENIGLLYEHSEALVVAGPLSHDDAKTLIEHPFEAKIPETEILLDHSGRRRRDLIRLCIEVYKLRHNFDSRSMAEGLANLATLCKGVYEHIFFAHFTQVQRGIIMKLLAQKAEKPSNSREETILVDTGILKIKDGQLELNGELLNSIFMDIVK